MGVQHSGFRSIPDVALDASPTSGVPVYDSYDGYQWVQVGGTSLSSPVWAAFMAIENSLRVAGGGTTIHQFLPDLYQTIYTLPGITLRTSTTSPRAAAVESAWLERVMTT